jgi:hypothetical protein
MREKIDDLACGIRVHLREDVRDVVDRVDAVLLSAGYERVEDGEVVTTKAGLGDVACPSGKRA